MSIENHYVSIAEFADMLRFHKETLIKRCKDGTFVKGEDYIKYSKFYKINLKNIVRKYPQIKPLIREWLENDSEGVRHRFLRTNEARQEFRVGHDKLSKIDHILLPSNFSQPRRGDVRKLYDRYVLEERLLK